MILNPEFYRLKIEQHHCAFQSLLNQVERFFEEGEYESAAIHAQVAAHYAWINHPGIHMSSRLETILVKIGNRLMPATDSLKGSNLDENYPRHVLHILTQAQSLGGHTRMACRWIQLDAKRSHSVALTRQGRSPIPQQLISCVGAVGGRIFALDQVRGGVVSRARTLRALLEAFDLVVLHIHPFDVVTVIGLAHNSSGLPIVFVNHADHVFWIGSSIVTLVANIRLSGSLLSQERRGIRREKCRMLPIPLVPVMPMLSRVDAKKQLGISKGDVVLLTIASGYKYTPIGEIDFANVLAPVLRQHKNALLLVVGPNINSYWQKALGQTGLRIRVEGPQENTAIYYQAADIYLDSFPFASLTSMLEAGSHGVPLISYCPHREVSPVMCTDDLGLDENLVRVTSPQGFQDAMSNLIQDSDLRLHLGQRIRKSIEAEHMGEGWAKRLSSIYRDATHEPIISEPLCVIDQKFSEPLDTWLAALNIEAGMCRDIDSLILEHGGLLPFGPRVRLLAKTLGETRRLYLRLLLSDYMRTRIRKAIKF